MTTVSQGVLTPAQRAFVQDPRRTARRRNTLTGGQRCGGAQCVQSAFLEGLEDETPFLAIETGVMVRHTPGNGQRQDRVQSTLGMTQVFQQGQSLLLDRGVSCRCGVLFGGFPDVLQTDSQGGKTGCTVSPDLQSPGNLCRTLLTFDLGGTEYEGWTVCGVRMTPVRQLLSAYLLTKAP